MSGGDQFNLPKGDRVLFRIPFNVDAATGADFTRFIEDVVGRIRNHIQRPRRHGTGTMVLPCPQAGHRTWFIIELRSRGREMSYSVPVLIEAETIYLHGYRNQHGDVFQFAGDNYLGGRSLSFSCNYESLVPSTRQQGGGDPGLVLEPVPDVPQQGSSMQQKDKNKKKEPERKSPNFGQERLRVAVRELAEGRNPRGESQHGTAQNLLLVIIRFCESIRNRFIRAKMADLWTVPSSTGQPSRCLSLRGFGQIKNWNKLAISLQDSARHAPAWPRNLADKTGVHSAAEAQEVLVLVLFHEDENVHEPNRPEWIPPPDDYNKNNNRRRHGGGGGGAAGGVYAAELPVTRWLPVPRDPVMEILGVYVRRQPGLQGVYGTVTVDDGLGAQTIFRRSMVLFGRDAGDPKAALMTLGLNLLDRSVSAADSWCIDVDLWSYPSAARLSTGRITWNICDFSTNTYDRVMRKSIGEAVVEYVVYSSAMKDTAVDDTADDIRFELGPGSSMAPADYYGYGMVDDNVTPDHTSSSAGRHEHDELRRRRR